MFFLVLMFFFYKWLAPPPPPPEWCENTVTIFIKRYLVMFQNVGHQVWDSWYQVYYLLLELFSISKDAMVKVFQQFHQFFVYQRLWVYGWLPWEFQAHPWSCWVPQFWGLPVYMDHPKCFVFGLWTFRVYYLHIDYIYRYMSNTGNTEMV